jgi:hypothetical protein
MCRWKAWYGQPCLQQLRAEDHVIVSEPLSDLPHVGAVSHA